MLCLSRPEPAGEQQDPGTLPRTLTLTHLSGVWTLETSHSSALVSGLIRLSGSPGPFTVETEGQWWCKKEPYGMSLLVMASQKEEGTLGYKSPGPWVEC